MMRKTLFIAVAVALLASLAACATVAYTHPQFKSKARLHKKIAVLPFHMVFSGNLPKNMTAQQKMQIEEAEALAFQKSLYHAILHRSGTRKKQIYIEVQRVEETNRLLTEKNISIRDAWQTRPEELAKTLGVDAVVRSHVEKVRYMSDLASFGIDLAEDLLEILKGQLDLPIGLPPGTQNKIDQAQKTFDINSECEIVNAEDGSLLWKYVVQTETDWNTPANEIINGLNRGFARRFPYINKIRRR